MSRYWGDCFCHNHFKQLTLISKTQYLDDPLRCATCKELVGEAREINQVDLAAAHATYKAAAMVGTRGRVRPSKAKEKAVRKRGDDFNGCQPRGERSRFLELSDSQYLKVPFAHSSKTREILKATFRWQDDALDDKIITKFPVLMILNTYLYTYHALSSLHTVARDGQDHWPNP